MATKSSSSSKSSTKSSSTGKTLKAWNWKVVNVKAGQLTASQSNLLASKGYKVQTALSWGTYDAQNGEQVSAPAEPVKKAPAVVPEAAKVAPPAQQVADTVEPVTPETTRNVVKTDALQARIDARNKAGLNAVTNPYTQKPEDVGVVQSEWVKAENAPVTPVVEPVQVTTPEETKTPVVEPVKTPEQLKQESDAAKANAEAQKISQEEQLNEIKTKEVDPANEDEAFAVLAAWGSLKKSMKNATFSERYRMYKSISIMSADDIATKNANGELTSSQLSNLEKYKPEKFAEVEQLTSQKIAVNNINSTGQRLYNQSTGKTTVPQKNKSDEIMEEWMTRFNEGDAYTKSLMNKLTDWEVSDMAVDIARLDAEAQEIEDAMEYQYDDMRGQFPNVPKAIMMGMVAAQNKELNRTLNTKIRERAIAVAEYNAKKEDIRTQIEFSQTSMKNTMDFLWNMFNITRAEEIREEDFVRADKLLADEILRADKKDQQRIDELKQTRADTMALALAWAWVDPTKYNTYEGMLAAYSTAVKNKMIEDKKNKPSASDWKEFPDYKWGTYWENLVTGEKRAAPPVDMNDYSAKPTWTLISVNTGNKNVQVDMVAAWGLDSAIKEMKNSGIYVVTGRAARDQAQTIKEMWDRVGMPWATAAQLRAKGHQIADVGSSKHEWGMAIDLYSSPSLERPSQQQIDIMERNGWKHMGIKWDMGHFEYVGTLQTQGGEKTYTDNQITVMQGLDPSTVSKEEKATLKNNWLTEAEWMQYRKNNGIYSEQQLLNTNKADTWFTGLPEVKSYKEMYTQNEGIMQSLLADNPVGDVGMVYQFMKTLDPTSVVRESEFGLAANASGFADRNEPANLIRKVKDGRTLTPKQAQQMAALSQAYVKAKATVYNKSYQDYLNKYKKVWLAPEEANIGNITATTSTSDFTNMSDADIWANL